MHMEDRVPKKFVVIGDSIADCGRVRPVGEGGGNSLGDGYVDLLQSMVRVDHPEWGLRVINMGVSGDTSRHLVARWQTDLLDLSPDYVLIMIGCNEAWRYFDMPLITEIHVSLAEYEQNLKRMIDSAEAISCKVILASPFYLEPNRGDAMRAKVDEYAAKMRQIAQERQLPFIDVQETFDHLLERQHTCIFSDDRVHPNRTGQYAIASTVLRALEGLFGA